MEFASEIEQTVCYLSSLEAARALEADAYWPKWHSPWWHMLLLHEMGHAALIPDATVTRYVAALNRVALKIFPIRPDELPPGVDPYRGVPCHCQLGNVYQVLAARGIDVDAELPWIRPWLLSYQMADGGLNCDSDAYLVADECPSSMVGTIAVFEAVLLHTKRPWTDEERTFLTKAARFLMARQLRFGSATRHNAAERTSAAAWTRLCFPRFYFYDVLRGLDALTLWAEKTGEDLPPESIRFVTEFLARECGDKPVRIGRLALEGTKTMGQATDGAWTRGHAATKFPLLDAVSQVGEESPFLTRQWQAARDRVARHGWLSGND